MQAPGANTVGPLNSPLSCLLLRKSEKGQLKVAVEAAIR